MIALRWFILVNIVAAACFAAAFSPILGTLVLIAFGCGAFWHWLYHRGSGLWKFADYIAGNTVGKAHYLGSLVCMGSTWHEAQASAARAEDQLRRSSFYWDMHELRKLRDRMIWADTLVRRLPEEDPGRQQWEKVFGKEPVQQQEA